MTMKAVELLITGQVVQNVSQRHYGRFIRFSQDLQLIIITGTASLEQIILCLMDLWSTGHNLLLVVKTLDEDNETVILLYQVLEILGNDCSTYTIFDNDDAPVVTSMHYRWS